MHMHIIRALGSLAVSGSLLLVAGCATGPEAVENDFGNSVRHMTQAQIANPTAPADNEAIDHGSGMRINGAIEAYQKGVSDPNDVKQDITLGVSD
jgi:starvation-inducible outer membrane lipoprotein